MLHEFHARTTAQIFASAGTANKCMGDAMFAVFSVPMAVPDDARNLGGLAEWNFERTNKGETPLAIGIGLNYGPAVLGNVGSA